MQPLKSIIGYGPHLSYQPPDYVPAHKTRVITQAPQQMRKQLVSKGVKYMLRRGFHIDGKPTKPAPYP